MAFDGLDWDEVLWKTNSRDSRGADARDHMEKLASAVCACNLCDDVTSDSWRARCEAVICLVTQSK